MDLLWTIFATPVGTPKQLEVLVTPTALESTNGMLVAVLILVTAGALWNLATICRDVRAAPPECFPWPTRRETIYHIGKPSLALAVGFGGLLLNVGTKWFLRWLANHGYSPPAWASYSSALVLLGAVSAVVGLLCWLRVTVPDKVGLRAWLAMLVCCLAFGALMAFSPG